MAPHEILSLHAALQINPIPTEAAKQAHPPKRPFQPYHAKVVPRAEDLEARAQKHAADGGTVTTMMLRNIPNRYSQQTLLQEIDSLGFAGTYDFFYLPMDVHHRSSVGYAFINFEMPQHAARFHRVLSEHPFQLYNSQKVASVCTAHVQGLENNLRHFQHRAVTQARDDQYRPIVLKNHRRVYFEDALLELKAADHGAGGKRGAAAQGQRGHRSGRRGAEGPSAARARNTALGAARSAGGRGGGDARESLEASIFNLLVSKKGRSAAAPAAPFLAPPSFAQQAPPCVAVVAGPHPSSEVQQMLQLLQEVDVALGPYAPAPSEERRPLGAGDKAPAYVSLLTAKVPAYINLQAAGPSPVFGAGDETPRTCGLHLWSSLDCSLSGEDSK